MQPVFAGGRVVAQFGKLRLNEIRKVRRIVFAQHTRLPAGSRFLDLLEVPVRGHTRLPRLARIGVAVGLLVLLLDEEPVLLVLGGIVFHQHKGPAPLQALALEIEFERALLQPLFRVLTRLPFALVPEHDGAGPIAIRYNAFKVAIIQWVVFRAHGQALVSGVEARPLGHGPAFKHAVELQPEIIVETARIMFLHNEGEPLFALPLLSRPRGPIRLRRAAEIPLLAIGLEIVACRL